MKFYIPTRKGNLARREDTFVKQSGRKETALQLLKTFAFVLAAITLTFVQPVSAQDADVDQARTLLQRGQEQFEAMEYADAVATLKRIEQDTLPDADGIKAWKDLLLQSEQALAGQQTGQEDFMQASSLLNNGDFAAATDKFQAVMDNKFVPEALKRDAAAMLNVAKAKAGRAADMQARKAAAAEKAVTEKAAAEEEAATEKAAAEMAAFEKAAIEKAALEAEKAAAEKAAAEKAAAEKAAAEKAAAEKAAAEKAAAEKAAAEKAAAEKAAAEMAALREKAKLYRATQKASEFVAQGQRYMEVGAADKAMQSFQQALSLDSSSVEAEKGFKRAQAMLAAGSPSTSSMDILIRRRAIALQESKAKYDAAMVDAAAILDRAATEADFVTAADRARFAMSLVQTNKQLYPTMEFDVRIAKATELLDRIAERQSVWKKEQLRAIREKATQKAEEYEAEQRKQRSLKIGSLKDSIRLLEEQRKWEQAIEATEEILRLDPASGWASSRLELLRTYRTAFSQRSAYKAKMDAEQKHAEAFAWDSIPWYDLLRFPKDWADLSRRRSADSDGSESAADRSVRLQLEAVQPVFDFLEMELGDVIEFIRDASNVNITVNWAELDNAGVSPDTPITLKLASVSTARALEEALSSVGGIDPLGYVIKDGVVRISTKLDLATIVDTVVYDIKDILFSTPNFEGPVLSSDNSEASDGGGGNEADLFDDDEDEDDDDAEGERQQAIDNLLNTITTSIDYDSWSENGGPGSVSALNGMMIITQTPENHRRIADLLKELRDSESVQINVEARYISVTTGFLNDVGLSLNFFLNTGSMTTGTGYTGPLGTTPNIVTPNSANTQMAQWEGTKAMSNSFTPISMLQNSSAFTGGPATSVPGGIGEAVNAAGASGLTLAGTFLDDIQVDFLLQATQADQKSSTFLAPRITFTNGQRAYIAFTKGQSYVSDLEAVTDENVIGYEQTVSTLTTGNTLDVEAVASADRRYVTMTLRPSLTNLDALALYEGTVGYIQLPEISETRYRATVKVPDGGTLLIGGQRRAGEVTLEMGTPILNKIPIINRLFSNRSTVRDEFMTILLIKPTIIISKEYESYDVPN